MLTTPIDIHTKEQSEWQSLGISWEKTALCSKLFNVTAYSRPEGDDAKSLKVRINESKGLNGCEIKSIEEAFRFIYNFAGKKAELSIDKSAIIMKAAHASIPLIVSGNYGFKDEVMIKLTHKPRLICELKVVKPKYIIRPNDETIAELVIKSDAFSGGNSIAVTIEKKSSCDNYVYFHNDNKTSISDIIQPNLQNTYCIDIIGNSFPKGLTEDHNCEIEIKEGNLSSKQILKLLSGESRDRNNCIPKEKEVIVSLGRNLGIECQWDDITVFTGMPPKEFVTEVKANGFDANVTNNNTDCELVTIKGQLSTIKKGATQKLPLMVSPDKEASERECNLTISSDYSISCSKKISIITKESKPSKGEVKMSLCLDEYYLGQGKATLGKLTIKCVSNCNNKDQVRHLHVNTKDLACSLDPFVTFESKEIDLALGEEVSVEFYIEATEDSWNLPIGKTKNSIVFDGVEQSKDIDVKERIPEPMKPEFKPIEPFTLLYDEAKSLLQIGTLETTYTPKPKEIGYLHRENGMFSFNHSSLCFANGNKEQVLESGKKGYPVYLLLNDEDKCVTSDVSIVYKDNLEEKKTDVIALPILEVSWIDAEKGKIVAPRDTRPINEQIKAPCHVFSSNLRNQGSQKCFEIVISNRQSIVQKDKRIEVSSISFTSTSDFVTVNTSDIRLDNGITHAFIQFIIDYNRIPIPCPDQVDVRLSFVVKIIEKEGVTSDDRILKANFNILLPLEELIYDKWYSIDLGTTGIVVARWDYSNNQIGPVVLHDEQSIDDRIEEDDNIISSNTILKCNDGDKNKCKVVVSPSLPDWKFCDDVLVPSKFIVGQDHIPYSKIFAEHYPDGAEFEDGNIKTWKDIAPSDIIKFTYETIFNRIGDADRQEVRKLIITYPNTYTPVLLEWLRKLIIEKKLFPKLKDRDLHLIPESDAVVAYYINKQINGNGIQINRGKPTRMVIYDMGAGTLDLSLVEMTNTGKELKASFINRIGIPIAGEYFTYLLYEQYQGKWAKVNKGLKVYLDKVKRSFDINKPLQSSEETQNYVTDKNVKIEIGKELKEWIEICTDEIFSQLVGKKWVDNIDVVVFSGRGSQFKPIRDAIKAKCNKKNIKIDDTSISTQELKQCVAHGAILYQQIFQNENRPFFIEHHSTSLNLGLEYTKLGEGFKICRVYDQMLGEEDFQEEDYEVEGSYFSSYKPKSKQFDFSEDGEVIFYLTPFSQDEMNKLIKDRKNKKWCFVSTLFSFHTSLLGLNNSKRKNANVCVETDSNNRLFIKVMDINLNEKATVENIENNAFYNSCNWFLNNNK